MFHVCFRIPGVCCGILFLLLLLSFYGGLPYPAIDLAQTATAAEEKAAFFCLGGLIAVVRPRASGRKKKKKGEKGPI